MQRKEEQKRIDGYMKEKPKKEITVKYSSQAFKAALIEWLVATDQVCSVINIRKGCSLIVIAFSQSAQWSNQPSKN